eukprot:330235_1
MRSSTSNVFTTLWRSRTRLIVLTFIAIPLLTLLMNYNIIARYYATKQHDPMLEFINNPQIQNNNQPSNNKQHLIKLTDRQKSSIVIVGYCCHTHSGMYNLCEPQKFVTDIAEGTFHKINKKIIYQQCTKFGLAPKIFINPYSNISTSSQHIKIKKYLYNNTNLYNKLLSINNKLPIWYEPDILLCQGYFFDNSIIENRNKYSQRISINIEEEIKLYHHLNVPYNIDNYDENMNIEYNENLKESIRLSSHNKQLYQHYNRPFLTTYNTEFWGGGQCNRYDIIMESVFDRTLHGCVTVYIPAAFYFESERSFNHIDELIIPNDIVIHNLETNNYELSIKQKEYIDSVLSIKDKNKFVMFLVRDCYKSKYHIDAVLRVIMYDTLNEYKHSDSMGGCRRKWDLNRNIDVPHDYCPKNSYGGLYLGKMYNCTGYGWTDGVVSMAKRYKFMIAFENSKIKGYSTEKIFNALYAKTIPIYFGDPMITQYLNPNRIIHCNTITDKQINEMRKIDNTLDLETIIEKVKPIVFEDINKCVEKVKMVDQNDELYYNMLLQPVFVNNTYRNTVIDPDIIGDKLRYALKLHDSYLLK